MSVKELTEREVVSELQNLEQMNVGTDECKATVDHLVKVMDRYITMEQNDRIQEEKDKVREFEEDFKKKAQEIERDFKQKQFEFEKDLKQKQFEFEKELKLKQLEAEERTQKFEYDLKAKLAEDEKKGRVVRDIITAAGIVLPIAVTIWGTKKSFEFEKEGTITTILGRGFVNKLLPKK